MTVSAAILAGGENIRMERKNKAFLQMGGRSFLARTVGILRPIFQEIMVIGHDRQGYAPFGVSVHTDLRPGNGSLGGILTALARSSSERTFCVACDMPFLNPRLVSYLVERSSEGWEAVLPRLSKGLEPLCAVYSSALIPRIEELLDRGERRVRLALDEKSTCFAEESDLRSFDPELLTFININTPEDLSRAVGMAEEKHS
jgi:molybdopterin-guanine dinucleotide biosynthesis protein A